MPDSPHQNDDRLSDDDFVNVSNVHGFEELFGPGSKHKQETASPESTNKKEPDGPAPKDKPRSIRFGSKVLISGPPGAGKTTFALATVRAMMASVRSRQRISQGEKSRTIAYYISSEVDEEQLKRSFESFGWFDSKETREAKPAAGKDPFQFYIDSSEPDKTNFYAITPMPEVDRPVPSPEELVNGIFSRIARTLLPSEAPAENAKIYVIIDSITALLKGCTNAGDERRQTHEIVRRLLDRFNKDDLATIILLAEQDHRSQDPGNTSAPVMPTEPSVEDYLADIVFRLYVRNMPLGRRMRVLEVVKSQGVNMTLGEHTWQIVSDENVDELLRDSSFQNYIRTEADGISKEIWGNVIIFPRPRLSRPLRPIGTQQVRTGTDALHEVNQGSVTLIAGPMSCGKTTLCKNFLNIGGQAEVLSSPTMKWREGGMNGDPPRDSAELHGAKEEFRERFLFNFDTSIQKPSDNDYFKALTFTQSQFDLNVLVAHISFILGPNNGGMCKRIAFDGLSEWITMFDKPEAARMLEALMVTVRQKRVGDGNEPPPTVFITYELPLGDDPLGPSALGTAADNILVIRPLAINDINRKIIYILKPTARFQRDNLHSVATADHPFELRRNEAGKLVVDPHSLDAYTGLLSKSGEVQPARVLVQLFWENEFEKRFNKSQQTKLKSKFGLSNARLRLTFTDFNLSEIGSTLDKALTLGAGTPGEAFNLSIHLVDEWWLGSSSINKFLLNLRGERKASGRSGEVGGEGEPVANRNIPNSQDFWWWEMDKAAKKFGNQNAYYALPGYQDFGMLCFNPAGLDDTVRKTHPSKGGKSLFDPSSTPQPNTPVTHPSELKKLRAQWAAMVQSVPRRWVRTSGDWFQLLLPKTIEEADNLLDYALHLTGQSNSVTPDRRPVFTFDASTRETCACMFLELAWAFGSSEALLGNLFEKESTSRDENGIRQALKFLQFMILEGLILARCTAESKTYNDKPILFSRQWYSTFRRQQSEQEGNTEKDNQMIALPFMPVGQSDPNELLVNLLDDIAVRLHYWCQRAFEYMDAGNPSLKCEQEWVNLEAAKCKLLKTANQFWVKELSTLSTAHVVTMIEDAFDAYDKAREWLLIAAAEDAPGRLKGTQAAWSPDLDDMMELATWAAMRLQFLLGTEDGKIPKKLKAPNTPAGMAIRNARWVRHYLPDLKPLVKERLEKDELPCPVATGYVCMGSWMYGVGAKSRSDAIQSQVLAELTSLESAQARAKAGAGIPARKDFFSLNGNDPVEGMPYLNWRELLRYGGFRARRRDRLLAARPQPVAASNEQSSPKANDPSRLYDVIHQEMLACMRIADIYREQYYREQCAKNDTGKVRDDTKGQTAIEKVKARADVAFEKIREAANSLVQYTDRDQPSSGFQAGSGI